MHTHTDTWGEAGREKTGRIPQVGWLRWGPRGGGGGPTQRWHGISPSHPRQGSRVLLLVQTLPLCPPAPAHSAGPALQCDLSGRLQVPGLEFGVEASCFCLQTFLVSWVSLTPLYLGWGALGGLGPGNAVGSGRCIKLCAPGPSPGQVAGFQLMPLHQGGPVRPSDIGWISTMFFSCWAPNLCVEVLPEAPVLNLFMIPPPSQGLGGPWDSVIRLAEKWPAAWAGAVPGKATPSHTLNHLHALTPPPAS